VFVIGAAVIGTATTVATAMLSVVIPIYTAQLNNRLAELTTQSNSRIAGLTAQLESLRQQVRDAKGSLDIAVKARSETLVKLRALELKDVFAGDSVVPTGWRQVQIGDTQEAVTAAFPKIVKDSRLYWSAMDAENAAFKSATFYFDILDWTPRRQVKHILYFFAGPNMEATRTAVTDQLIQRFGKPSSGIDSMTEKPTQVWMVRGFKLTLLDNTLHVEATCASRAEIQRRGVPTARLELCD